ncbi:hypothetical protein [Geoalkalibacter subterraneus]|uniref:Uncharacterized protein n=1 Tax=Geoalkalibacter subterraneus TaxID=483547 RepID=A0A0B5FS51_9BACT|nr:hypothetical protein [Geoalkalibacter subterraneus]AJF07479.1 hypothetical protein GSUB_14240 [Geoalkalibacter subterraneus]
MSFVRTSLVALLATMFLAACGGSGGSGGSSGSDTPPVSGSGIAVDPYIVGAVFNEVLIDPETGDEEILQRSTPSDEHGYFSFDEPFSEDSVIVISDTRGLHNGIPFNGRLKRKVDDNGTLVTSPITTLLAEGMDEKEAAILLAGENASEEEIEAFRAKLKLNPMTEPDHKLLVAAMAINTALTATNNNINDQKLEEVFKAVSKILDEKIFNPENEDKPLNTRIGTSVGLTDFIAKKIQSDDSFDIETGVSDILIRDAMEKAGEDGKVAIDDDGTVDKPSEKVADSLKKGFAALDAAAQNNKTDDLLAATRHFKMAAALTATDAEATRNDKDAALFFGSMAQVMSLANPYSSTVSSGYNRLGDILDAFGFYDERDDISLISYPEECTTVTTAYGWTYEECVSDPLPQTTPTSGELQQFLFNRLGSELTGAANTLSQVSSQFSYQWTDPVDASTVQFDYADALFLSSVAHGMLGQLNIQQAYNLDIDISEVENKLRTENSLDQRTYTAEDFLQAHPELGTLKADYTTRLDESKKQFNKAADQLLAAFTAMEEETDDQRNNFINFYTEDCAWIGSAYECTENPEKMAADIEEAKANIAQFKDALDQPVIFENDPADSSDNETIDFSRLFEGIDLREQIPPVKGNVPGMFEDPTLDNLLIDTHFDLNQDLDEDGSPDLLVGFSQFGAPLVSGRTFDILWSYCGVSGTLQINEDSTYNYTWSDWYTNDGPQQSSGTWSIEEGRLNLTGDSFDMTAEMDKGNGLEGESLDLDIWWSQSDNQGCFGYWN